MSAGNPYHVSGIADAPFYGRTRIVNTILQRLNNPTPIHLSVVGPKSIGKSALLKHVTRCLNENDSVFDACVYWNVHRSYIETDAQFYQALAGVLAPAISEMDETYGAALREAGEQAFDTIRDVLETLDDEKKKILLVMDDLDSVLLTGQTTKTLWEFLRSMAERSVLWLVTGSRKNLRELCNSPEARASQFWNIFHTNPIRLGAFDEEDWPEVLSPFASRKISFEKGAETELRNWTGGIPVLTMAFCDRLWEETADATSITQTSLHEQSASFFQANEVLVPDLWQECDIDERTILTEIACGNNLPLATPGFLSLVQKGCVYENKGTIKLRCRALEQYAKSHGAEINSLRRLFGTSETFLANISNLIELRKTHVSISHPDIQVHLTHAIQLLDTSPRTSLGQIRGIMDDVFELIWDAELPSRQIPQRWTDQWRAGGVDQAPAGNVPAEGGRRCRLLGLMTDNRYHIPTKISRKSYYLLNSLQSFGDFGQHLQGELLPKQYAALVCWAVIELLDQLSAELQK